MAAPVPSAGRAMTGLKGLDRSEAGTRKKNCKLRISIMYRLLKSLLSPSSTRPRTTLAPGMRFVAILGANRIHVASSTDTTGYYAGTGRKLNIVRTPRHASALFAEK